MSPIWRGASNNCSSKFVNCSSGTRFSLKMGSLDYTVSPRIVCIFVQKIYIALFESVLIRFELPILFVTLNTLGPES